MTPTNTPSGGADERTLRSCAVYVCCGSERHSGRNASQALRPWGEVGGEEFLIIAPSTSLEEATALAERIRAVIEQTPIQVGDITISITASFGVSVASASDHGTEPLMVRADSALYAAKDAGRNAVRTA